MKYVISARICPHTICPVWSDNPKSIKWWKEVGLVASGFQFFSRLAAVFAEKVGDLFL